jgi:hypothetical protein
MATIDRVTVGISRKAIFIASRKVSRSASVIVAFGSNKTTWAIIL